MTHLVWLSWLVGALAASAMLIIGRGRVWGWLVTLSAQIGTGLVATISHQYGLYIQTAVCGVLAVDNYRRGRRARRDLAAIDGQIIRLVATRAERAAAAGEARVARGGTRRDLAAENATVRRYGDELGRVDGVELAQVLVRQSYRLPPVVAARRAARAARRAGLVATGQVLQLRVPAAAAGGRTEALRDSRPPGAVLDLPEGRSGVVLSRAVSFCGDVLPSSMCWHPETGDRAHWDVMYEVAVVRSGGGRRRVRVLPRLRVRRSRRVGEVLPEATTTSP